MNNDIIANPVQIEAIKDYISKRFATYNIAPYRFNVKETITFTYGHRLLQKIEPQYLGIFKHAVGSITHWLKNKFSISRN